MKVSLVTITPDAEATIIYIARVSSPENQNNSKIAGLIKYCIEHQHWSIFEQAFMTLEIETSLAIATQILRHRSFTFQQFSARYSDPTQMGFESIEWRLQAEKNRQSSLDTADPQTVAELDETWQMILEDIQNFYDYAISIGIAKECARFVLPTCTNTKLYVSGNIRSWIHYLQLRTGEDTQLEHRLVALEAQKIFTEQLPIISDALDWKE